ncbi:hypothetical protein PENTCL1PPCAC_1853, partial [Pristionchus entomophagus]
DAGIHDETDKIPVDLAREMGFEEAVAFFDFEATHNREQPVNKKRRRGTKDGKDMKRRRSNNTSGYNSSSPIHEEEEEEIVKTQSRQLFP